MFTQEELLNIKALIMQAPITGKDSMVVGNLLIKVDSLLKKDEKTSENK